VRGVFHCSDVLGQNKLINNIINGLIGHKNNHQPDFDYGFIWSERVRKGDAHERKGSENEGMKVRIKKRQDRKDGEQQRQI